MQTYISRVTQMVVEVPTFIQLFLFSSFWYFLDRFSTYFLGHDHLDNVSSI